MSSERHTPCPGSLLRLLATALLAVGGATLTVGRDWIGTEAAVALDALLFTAGTVVGPAAAAVHTARGLLSGSLLRAPRPGPAAPRPATVRTTSGAAR
jgi:hypothetical protein